MLPNPQYRGILQQRQSNSLVLKEKIRSRFLTRRFSSFLSSALNEIKEGYLSPVNNLTVKRLALLTKVLIKEKLLEVKWEHQQVNNLSSNQLLTHQITPTLSAHPR